MTRNTLLTFGAIAAIAVLGAATLPAIAGGGPWGMMDGNGPRMMMHGGESHGHGRMGIKGPMGMNGLAENPVFQSFDADKDGKVTSAEVEVGVEALLATHDVDKNGALSEAEFATLFVAVTKGMAARPFAKLDGDGNKEISAEEITFPVKMMARMGRLSDVNVGTPANP